MGTLWLSALLPFTVYAVNNHFASSPFDNFRIECPKGSGGTGLGVKMVESVGAARQDVVFDLSCDDLNEIYPWVNMPGGVRNVEREDCYYSKMFDPIIDESVELSCKSREYLAGITRISETRIQVLCCRLRSRDEFNCNELQFNKPLGQTRSTIIENERMLINAVSINGMAYVVRFCDLAPRNIDDIMEDVPPPKRNFTKPSTTSTSLKPTTRFTATNPYLTKSTTPSTTSTTSATTTTFTTTDTIPAAIPTEEMQYSSTEQFAQPQQEGEEPPPVGDDYEQPPAEDNNRSGQQHSEEGFTSQERADFTSEAVPSPPTTEEYKEYEYPSSENGERANEELSPIGQAGRAEQRAERLGESVSSEIEYDISKEIPDNNVPLAHGVAVHESHPILTSEGVLKPPNFSIDGPSFGVQKELPVSITPQVPAIDSIFSPDIGSAEDYDFPVKPLEELTTTGFSPKFISTQTQASTIVKSSSVAPTMSEVVTAALSTTTIPIVSSTTPPLVQMPAKTTPTAITTIETTSAQPSELDRLMKRIQEARSEKEKIALFQQSIFSILGTTGKRPEEAVPLPVVNVTIPPTAPPLPIDDAVPAQPQLTIANVEFPQEPSSNQVLPIRGNRISKEDLPLRRLASPEAVTQPSPDASYLLLKTPQAEVQRRAPIRTMHPYVRDVKLDEDNGKSSEQPKQKGWKVYISPAPPVPSSSPSITLPSSSSTIASQPSSTSSSSSTSSTSLATLSSPASAATTETTITVHAPPLAIKPNLVKETAPIVASTIPPTTTMVTTSASTATSSTATNAILPGTTSAKLKSVTKLAKFSPRWFSFTPSTSTTTTTAVPVAEDPLLLGKKIVLSSHDISLITDIADYVDPAIAGTEEHVMMSQSRPDITGITHERMSRRQKPKSKVVDNANMIDEETEHSPFEPTDATAPSNVPLKVFGKKDRATKEAILAKIKAARRLSKTSTTAETTSTTTTLPFRAFETDSVLDNEAENNLELMVLREQPIEVKQMKQMEIRRAPSHSLVPISLSIDAEGLEGDKARLDSPIDMSKDAVRTFIPPDGKPMPMKGMVIMSSVPPYPVLLSNTSSLESSTNASEVERSAQNVSSTSALPTTTTQLPVSETSTPSSTTTTSTTSATASDMPSTTTEYNYSRFFRTRKPGRRTQRPAVLTFCTKEDAVRDEHGMIVACGGDKEWDPPRCPDGSGCFIADDSIYMICCPVALGR